MAEFRAPRSDCERMLHLRARTFAPLTQFRKRGKSVGEFGALPYRSTVGRRKMAEFRTRHSDCERMLHLRAHTFAPLTNSPYNLAILRHMALNVMQKEGSKGSLRGKFKRAAWND